ncbi:hypothetical protein EKO27_g9957 [Xylaria grammica]|uniref:Uncharacterized protein n=1 Tax=Xylaria grammica TaxID=363999 RepID=A0A439CSI8_9PEZI|nr:hypothetical protein EKO27_g9957 [Xylaria grammica]
MSAFMENPTRGAVKSRSHENVEWCEDGPSAHCKPQPRRQRRYISPYHESPVDLDKYDDEMNTASTTDKSNSKSVGAACRPDRYERCGIDKTEKRGKSGKPAFRPLATGCAANFEIFGAGDSTAVVLD